MAKKASEFRPELLDELIQGMSTQEDVFGQNGLIKRLTGQLVERMLRAELGHHLTEEREDGEERNRKNGTSAKTLLTDNGNLPIEVPRDRIGTFDPILVPKHVRRIKGLDDKIVALYARGLSTRDIQGHLLEIYGTEISPELISRVTEAVRDEIAAWQSRPLEKTYAVVWVDALMVKIRDEGVVQNKAVYVAIGLQLDGSKDILGLWIDAAEGAKFWQRILGELQARGVQDILIACGDGLKGLPQAMSAVFPRTLFQLCVVHQVRFSLSFVSWRDRRKIVIDLRAIYAAPSEEAALEALEEFSQKWDHRYPMIAESWRRNWVHIRPFLELPPLLRKIVYTTNAIESLNYLLRKIIKTKGHFPSDDAAIKLMFLALRNVSRKWNGKTPKEWNQVYAQLHTRFGERAEMAL